MYTPIRPDSYNMACNCIFDHGLKSVEHINRWIRKEKAYIESLRPQTGNWMRLDLIDRAQDRIHMAEEAIGIATTIISLRNHINKLEKEKNE